MLNTTLFIFQFIIIEADINWRTTSRYIPSARENHQPLVLMNFYIETRSKKSCPSAESLATKKASSHTAWWTVSSPPTHLAVVSALRLFAITALHTSQFYIATIAMGPEPNASLLSPSVLKRMFSHPSMPPIDPPSQYPNSLYRDRLPYSLASVPPHIEWFGVVNAVGQAKS